jgi:ribosomal 50S subunit-associated protein YjgA (DUF615 family)
MPRSLFDKKRRHAQYAGKKMRLFSRLQSLVPTVQVGDSKIKTLLCTIDYIEKLQYRSAIPAALEAALSTRGGKEWKKKIIEQSLEDTKKKIVEEWKKKIVEESIKNARKTILEEYMAEGDGGENVQM